jgi:dihydroorotate dehydrogenase (fumarate)
MGLELACPVIVGSSSLTDSVEGVVDCARAGAGAVVLKSVFEEQILAEVEGLRETSRATYRHPEAADYITRYGRENAVGAYIDLIRGAKDAVDIPVIASIHCVSAGAWTGFANRVELAGADALELNVFVMPSDPGQGGREIEQIYFDVASAVKRNVSIPVALKIGSYFSALAETITRLSREADGLVLFNRFYRVDFDIEKLQLIPGGRLSSPDEITRPLRWISILSAAVDCDLAATTGAHDGEGVTKLLLAGARAVQMCSALYTHGVGHIGRVLDDVRTWMERHGHATVDDFRGTMSRDSSEDPAAYERVQFMKVSRERP